MNDEIEIMRLKDRVALLERQIKFLLGQASTPYVDMPPASVAMPYADVAELKRKGKFIDAIKLYRERTGAGLADAKTFVENMEV